MLLVPSPDLMIAFDVIEGQRVARLVAHLIERRAQRTATTSELVTSQAAVRLKSGQTQAQ